MYCKLFPSLWQGSLRGRSTDILVFVNLLSHADPQGIVNIDFQTVSDEVGVPVRKVKEACVNLETADPDSRSTAANGARIQRLSEQRLWGWRIVNYLAYRALRTEEDRREQNRVSQQNSRKRRIPTPDSSTPCQQPSATVITVTPCQQPSSVCQQPSSLSPPSALSAHTEAEAEAEGERERTPPPLLTRSAVIPSEEEVLAYAGTLGLVPWKARDWWQQMESVGWRVRGSQITAWQPALARVRTQWEADGRPMAPPSFRAAGNGSRPSSVSELRTMERVLTEKIAASPANSESTACVAEPTPAQREALQKQRAVLRELKAKIEERAVQEASK